MGGRDALIIATGTYDDARLRMLRSPVADATALREALSDPEVGGFEVPPPVVDATHTEIETALHDFLKSRRSSDTLLIHISSHGVKDDEGRLFFAARDTDLDRLEVNGIAASWLKDLMANCRAGTLVLLLDCCFAGAWAQGSKSDSGVHLQDQLLTGRGRAVLTATNHLEYAWEGGALQGEARPSVFTQALVDGLRSGDADRDGDGRVTIPELHTFTHDRMLDAEHPQEPSLWLSGMPGGVYVALNAAVRPALPREVLDALASPLAGSRAGVTTDLERLLRDAPDPRTRREARRALQRLHEDDSRLVSEAAGAALARADPSPDPPAPAPAPTPPTPTPPAPTPPTPTPPAPTPPAPTPPTPTPPAPTPPGPSPPGPSPDPGPEWRKVAWLAGGVAAALLLIVVLTSGGGETTDSRTTVVTVPADTPWTDTGIDLDVLDRVVLTAEGTIRDAIEVRPEQSFGPQGEPDVAGEHPGDPFDLNHAALIGRVDSAEPFLVGDRAEIPPGSTGRLELGINDSGFDDNDGTFTVRVTVVRTVPAR